MSLLKKWLTIGCLALLSLSLLPHATSLYDLTGEERFAAQIRGILHWLGTAVRPQPHLGSDPQIEYGATSSLGVNTFLEQEVEVAKRDKSLELIQQAGFSFIRQEFVWEDIEVHGKGDFVDRRNDANGVDAWQKYDNIVALAEAHDLEVIARLGNPPAWTRSLTDTIGTYAPPDDFHDFADFAATVANRFRGRISYFQIWNEPNGNEEWGKQDVDPESYTELLCLAYARIKLVNPDAVVLAAALSPTVAMDGRNMNDLIYLQRMYIAGAGECFDVYSAQGYGLWSGPSDQRLRPTVINYPHHMFVRDVMVRNGDAAKPIWISEMGWNSVPEDIPATYGRVSEEQQARYTVEAYSRAKEEWPWLGVVNYWYFKRPSDLERDQAWYYFRLMEPDFTPLPVYDAVEAYAKSPSSPGAASNWIYRWNSIRATAFSISSAWLFFATIGFLAPTRSNED